MNPLRRTPRGFTLIEIMVAATVSIIIIMVTVGVSLQLQRRGMLEERIMETQNAGRATRDLMAFGVQSAGAAVGSTSLTGGTSAPGVAAVRYAVWPRTQATFSTDTTFVAPPTRYAGVRSDALEVWETDPGLMIPLDGCGSVASPWTSGSTALCTRTQAPANLLPAGMASRTVAVVFPGSSTIRPWGCLGVVTAINPANPPGTPSPSVTLTLGLPGDPTPATGNCAAGAAWTADGMYLIPVRARTYRVNWPDGGPAFEMDDDGVAGANPFREMTRDIEQLRVRMGVQPPNSLDGGIRFFPETSPVRPALDQCTQATCASHISWAWDAGTTPPNQGVGSAADELMRHVRVVEVSITARSQRMDDQETTDGGVDEYGNIQDGFKRRHTILRLAPRNFGYVGTDD